MDRRAFNTALMAIGSSPAMTAFAQDAVLSRPIPSTGERLPAVGLGTWQVFDVAEPGAEFGQARATLAALVAAGGRMVDSSPMYGRSETVLGDLMARAGVRDKLFVATKVWTRGAREGVEQMRDSMRKLRVARIDLMQVHNLVDTDAHLATLTAWKREGRVRLTGITHYHAGAHRDLEAALVKHRVDTVQVNYSLAEPDADQRLLDACRDLGAAVIVNRPFAEGAMFRRVRGKALPDWVEAELGIASWAQFFLKWIVSHAAVTCAIPGTRNPAHAADNLRALRGPQPDAAQRSRMRQAFEAL